MMTTLCDRSRPSAFSSCVPDSSAHTCAPPLTWLDLAPLVKRCEHLLRLQCELLTTCIPLLHLRRELLTTYIPVLHLQCEFCWRVLEAFLFCTSSVSCWRQHVPEAFFFCTSSVSCWQQHVPEAFFFCTSSVSCWHVPEAFLFCTSSVSCWQHVPGSSTLLHLQRELLTACTRWQHSVAPPVWVVDSMYQVASGHAWSWRCDKMANWVRFWHPDCRRKIPTTLLSICVCHWPGWWVVSLHVSPTDWIGLSAY